jgi:uncharacterized protein (DUF4415 family)
MNAKQKNSKRTLLDSDTPPEITDEWIAGADLYHGKKLVRRGRPKSDNPKQLLSLRLPPNVIARWKATGPGWQTRMVETLEKSAPKARRAAG